MRNLASGIRLRLISVIVLSTILGLVFWLRPDFEPGMLWATTVDSATIFWFFTIVFFLGYLVVQGYPVSHGDIGDSSVHNLDNIISGIPAVAALFGILVHFAGFWPLSRLNLTFALITLLVVAIDLFVIGGAAAKINRLTDEIKSER
jgi:hypothetical protein